jgi:hypothetical protein
MLMGFILFLNMILWIGGFLIPVPCFILSCRESIRRRNITSGRIWRRRISQISLALFGFGLALWAYAVLRDYWGNYPYDALTATVGRWGSVGFIALCTLAESPVRRYLLLGAFGLLFFFGVSLGEIAI